MIGVKFGTRDGNIMLLSTFEFVKISVGQVRAAVHSKNIALRFVIVTPPPETIIVGIMWVRTKHSEL
jgi:hypothetical protein